MAKIVVLHGEYGCETGCCGHFIEVDGKQTDGFHFAHPYGKKVREFAEDLIANTLGAEHVKDLDWENCVVIDD